MARPKQPFPPPIKSHPASGQARTWWSGRWHYLGPHGSAEAQQNYARLLAQISTGKGIGSTDTPVSGVQNAPGTPNTLPDGPLTVSDVLASWWAREAPRRTARELNHFKHALRVVERLYGQLAASEFRRRHLRAVQEEYVRLGWCRNHVNRRIANVRTVWRWLEGEELVPDGRWGNLRTLAPLAPNDPTVRHSERRRAAAWGDVKKALRHLRPALRALVLVGWWTGARPGELRTLTAGEALEEGGGLVFRPRAHKTAHLGHSRVIVLGPKAQAAARKFLSRARAVGAEAYVFSSRKDCGRCYSDVTLCQAIRRACTKAGVSWSCYQLRHSAADRIRRREGSQAARCVLGQRSLQITDGYGDSIDVRYAAEVQRRLG